MRHPQKRTPANYEPDTTKVKPPKANQLSACSTLCQPFHALMQPCSPCRVSSRTQIGGSSLRTMSATLLSLARGLAEPRRQAQLSRLNRGSLCRFQASSHACVHAVSAPTPSLQASSAPAQFLTFARGITARRAVGSSSYAAKSGRARAGRCA